MSSTEVSATWIEPLTYRYVAADGTPIHGGNVRARIRRTNGDWLDWTTGTFGAYPSPSSDAFQTLSEDLDAFGFYVFDWDLATITNPNPDGDVYTVLFDSTDPTVRDLITGEVRVTFVDSLAASIAALATAVAALPAAAGFVAAWQNAVFPVASPGAAVTTYGQALALLPEWILGKQAVVPGSPGALNFYSRTNALLYSYVLTDSGGNAILAAPGSPFNRSAGA